MRKAAAKIEEQTRRRRQRGKEAIAKINRGTVGVEPESFSKQQEERKKRQQVQTDARDNVRTGSAGMSQERVGAWGVTNEG